MGFTIVSIRNLTISELGAMGIELGSRYFGNIKSFMVVDIASLATTKLKNQPTDRPKSLTIVQHC